MTSEKITRKVIEALPSVVLEDNSRARLLEHVLVEVSQKGDYIRVGKSKIEGYEETPTIVVLNKDGVKIKSNYDITDRTREFVFKYRVSANDAPYTVDIIQKPTAVLPEIKVEWLITTEHLLGEPKVI